MRPSKVEMATSHTEVVQLLAARPHGRRQGGLEERPRSADHLSTSRVRALMIGGTAAPS